MGKRFHFKQPYYLEAGVMKRTYVSRGLEALPI